MTDLKSLGLMLIEVADNGRVLQKSDIGNLGGALQWCSFNLSPGTVIEISSTIEYRLKPKLAYYRAYKFDGQRTLAEQSEPFKPWEVWTSGSAQHLYELLKDFEVSE